MLRTLLAAFAIAGTVALGAAPVAVADNCAYGVGSNGNCKAETPDQTRQRLNRERVHRVTDPIVKHIVDSIRQHHPRHQRPRGIN